MADAGRWSLTLALVALCLALLGATVVSTGRAISLEARNESLRENLFRMESWRADLEAREATHQELVLALAVATAPRPKPPEPPVSDLLRVAAVTGAHDWRKDGPVVSVDAITVCRDRMLDFLESEALLVEFPADAWLDTGRANLVFHDTAAGVVRADYYADSLLRFGSGERPSRIPARPSMTELFEDRIRPALGRLTRDLRAYALAYGEAKRALEARAGSPEDPAPAAEGR